MRMCSGNILVFLFFFVCVCLMHVTCRIQIMVINIWIPIFIFWKSLFWFSDTHVDVYRSVEQRQQQVFHFLIKMSKKFEIIKLTASKIFEFGSKMYSFQIRVQTSLQSMEQGHSMYFWVWMPPQHLPTFSPGPNGFLAWNGLGWVYTLKHCGHQGLN